MSSLSESGLDPGLDGTRAKVLHSSTPVFTSTVRTSSIPTTPMFSSSDPDSPFASMSPLSTPREPVTPDLAESDDSVPSEPAPTPLVEKPVESDVIVTEAPAIVVNPESPASVVEQSAETAVRGNFSVAPAQGMQPVIFTARKKGGTVKNWKSRYWLFEPTGGMLSYFEDKDRKNKKGHIDLSTCIGMGPIRHDREPYTLGLRTKDRLWVLAFDRMDELGRIQTLLGSVVQGSLEIQEVPVSALGKLRRLTSKKQKPNSNSRSSSPDKKNAEKSHGSASPSSSASSLSSNSMVSSGSGSNIVIISSDEPGGRGSTSSTVGAANANEKAALSKLNQNLNRLREYTGKEYTLECDMSVVRSRLESDHPEWKDRPGDVIYDGFMGALSNKIQELCEWSMYRDTIKHKLSGRIAIRISDDAKDAQFKHPYLKLDQGTLVIICHRSLLTASLIDLGDDLLDVLSIDEPLHICTLKDIEDHKQGIKSCLIKIQAQLGVTCQFECDYTEGFKTLLSSNPSAANTYKRSWGEVVFKYLEASTNYILKLASDQSSKANFIASIPNKAIRVSVVPNDEQNRASWAIPDGGVFSIVINASKFAPEIPISFC